MAAAGQETKKWVMLGQQAKFLVKWSLFLTCMCGTGHPRSRQATKVADPVETTATVLAETDKSENLTERELMVTYVFRNLVSRFREMEKKPINYFKFVLDPVCFGTSMFCVSFLVEEGKMDISVCEEIGLAMIVPLSRKNKGGHEE